MAAVLRDGHEVNANFTTSPFHEIEMKAGRTTVTSAFEIMGDPTTGLTFTSSEAFRSGNAQATSGAPPSFISR